MNFLLLFAGERVVCERRSKFSSYAKVGGMNGQKNRLATQIRNNSLRASGVEDNDFWAKKVVGFFWNWSGAQKLGK